MTTHDHAVPKMYLRRFGTRQLGNKHHGTIARRVDRMKPFPASVQNVGAVKNSHWAVRSDGTTHHLAEKLMNRIETASKPAFSTILDDHDFAFPRRWPLRPADRTRMAWYIAAQLLRTTRQRRRVDHLLRTADGNTLPAPNAVRSFAANNPHLDFIHDNLGPLAHAVYHRPWGLGFSDACLITGDVPVVVVNGQDAPDQLAATAY